MVRIVLVVFACFCAPLIVVHGHEPTTAQDESGQIKNVLFIISDDLKASVLGCYGDKICRTPNIDKLASQGMVFQRAYCQGTWCAPSRQSFMYSRYQSGGSVNLGQHFQSHGIFTARVGKIYHMRVPGDIIAGTNGLDVASTWTQRFNATGQEAHTPGDYACLNLNIFTDELPGRQSTKMPHRPFVTVQYEGDGSDQPDFKAAMKAIEILRERKSSDVPFLLAVGLVRPHYPMVAPKQFFEPYPWQEIELPQQMENDHADIPKMGMGPLSSKNKMGDFPDNQKRMWAGYYASVSFMDAQVGKIIDELEQLGLRESTAIVFTSDHGYHLGEHEFWQKSNLHEEVIRVPLVVSAPGYQTGSTLSPVELVDIYPTVSDLVGIEDLPTDVQGKSLVPILADPSARVRDAALSIRNGCSLRGDRWAYMRYSDDTEELYDMKSDPNQFTNLVSSPDHREALAENRAALETRMAQEGIEMNPARKKKSGKKSN